MSPLRSAQRPRPTCLWFAAGLCFLRSAESAQSVHIISSSGRTSAALREPQRIYQVDPLTDARMKEIPGATALEEARSVDPPLAKGAAGEGASLEAVGEQQATRLLRVYCSASFASGLTVGVVLTVLLLSVKADRTQGKGGSARAEAGASPGLEQESAMEATASGGRCTESVESIHRFGPRCSFLVAMLLVQSLSSLMLAGFQDLIQNHPSIIFFLTMVVGTGGNVGSQSVVLAVRRLAYGEKVSLSEQVVVGVQLAAVLSPLALLRAYAQGTKLAVCLTIGLATILIVILAAALGTALPKLLNQIRVDPAHATPVIQVLMDMVGVLVTCVIGHVVLDVMLKAPN